MSIIRQYNYKDQRQVILSHQIHGDKHGNSSTCRVWGRRCGDYVAVSPPGNSEAHIICNIRLKRTAFHDFSIHVKFLKLQELRAISATSLLGLGSSLIFCRAFPAYRRKMRP